jgi:hypothetical protein
MVCVEKTSSVGNEAKCKCTQKINCVGGCQSGGELFTPTFRLDYSAIALLIALWTERFNAGKVRAAL